MDQVFLSPLPFHFDRLHHSVFLFFRINILDFGFFFESFPSLAIWPTYCIRLSTFSFGPFEPFCLRPSGQLQKPSKARIFSDPWPLNPDPFLCGDEGTRTPGLCLAKAPLSQLSYIPSQVQGFRIMDQAFTIPYILSPLSVGLSGLEPETSPLSEARSNQLS